MPDHDDLLLAQANDGTPAREGSPLLADNGPKPGGAPGENAESPSVFTTLLATLGDHHELTFGSTHLLDLPVILIDNGFHVYPSVHAMEDAGLYKMVDHHIVGANDHTHHPALDMSVTSLIFFQWLAMLLMMVIFIPMAKKYKKRGARPLGGFAGAMESLVVYVRDQIVLPNTGKDGLKLMPVFLTIFFFILTMNLLGLVPGGHSATGSLNVTAGLAIVAFFLIQIASIAKVGIGNWLKHLTGGVHWLLWPIMVPVEILGLFTKPFALCMRLFANMTAGHIILLSLIGLSFVATSFIPVTLGFSLFINILELLVAFIQAYIFTMLTAVFTGMGMASHDHEHGDEGHAAAH